MNIEKEITKIITRQSQMESAMLEMSTSFDSLAVSMDMVRKTIALKFPNAKVNKKRDDE